LLELLYYPLISEPSAEFGNLPLIYISSSVTTTLPSDDLILQSTELSGIPVFEEIINLEDINKITDTFKEKLLELSKND